jgi:hypothetical protein
MVVQVREALERVHLREDTRGEGGEGAEGGRESQSGDFFRAPLPKAFDRSTGKKRGDTGVRRGGGRSGARCGGKRTAMRMFPVYV